MAALDQILAVLTARKVYDDSTNTWKVYDSLGSEIVDSSGILLHGLHGFLLRNTSPASWREFEVSLEPAWKKALRKRNKPARFNSGKSRRKAHQVEIRAAKSIVNTPDINENKLLSLYAEWLSFQPIISEDNTGDNAYSTFLEMVGRLLEEWENEEDEAILLLLG